MNRTFCFMMNDRSCHEAEHNNSLFERTGTRRRQAARLRPVRQDKSRDELDVERLRPGQGSAPGFIDAPQIGPAKSASSAITAPTAMPAVIPRSLAPTET